MGETRRVPVPGDTIHDLVDVIACGPLSGEKIHDLVEVMAESFLTSFPDPDLYRDEIMQRVKEITEKIAKEIVPDIAERVIREEIEKLKARYPDEQHDK
jgi:hypothetical protein